MWKDDRKLFEEMAVATWREIHQLGPFDARDLTAPVLSTPEGHEYMSAILGRVIAAYYAHSRHVSPSSWQRPPNAFASAFRKIITGVASEIETSENYTLVSDLAMAVHDIMMEDRDDSAALLSAHIAKLIHLLVGSESRWLVGTYDNVPIWRNFDQPIGSGRAHQLLLRPILEISMYLDFIGEHNAHLVPDLFDLPSHPDDLRRQMSPSLTSYKEIRKLLEDARRDQRYLLNPRGVTVHFSDDRVFRTVSLAIHTTGNGNTIDSAYLVGSAETVSGSWFKVMDFYTAATLHSDGGATSMDAVMAILYSLLTTATDVPTGPPLLTPSDGELATGPMPEWWVEVPREVGIPPFRNPIPSGRRVRDHPVQPYRRRLTKGKMSPQQWQRVQEYCAKHGLPLPEVPPGYTFVLEHRRGTVPEDTASTAD